MNIIDDINKNQIDILRKMGIGVQHFSVGTHNDKGIVYSIDFDYDKFYHFVCCYKFDTNRISYQISSASDFKSFSEDATYEEFSKKVIEYISKQIFKK